VGTYSGPVFTWQNQIDPTKSIFEYCIKSCLHYIAIDQIGKLSLNYMHCQMCVNEVKISIKKQQIIETVTLPKTFYYYDQKIINSNYDIKFYFTILLCFINQLYIFINNRKVLVIYIHG
jgi:hypothetical protein